ncbi:MAG: RagB/SusD family nutrient uptake outer membrane protein [Parabacteroides sp.]|nr:RagB/SusD family nutrient uptake outer membrane protein [Parabacteroides sp.]
MKKIYKTIRLLPVALLVVAFSGCNDQLTTEDAQKVSSETVLSSTVGLNMVLNSAYHYLLMDGTNGGSSQNTASYAGVAGLAMHYDICGADILSTTNYGGSAEDCYKYLQDRTMSSGSYPQQLWSMMYQVINESNTILDAIPSATGTDAEKNEIKGQALAMRGIAYFHLIMNFQQTYAVAKNKRGVILRTSSTDDESKGFSTVEECYAQILSDLISAKSTLANYNRDEKWRINADVVSGMLARVYQVMGNWQSAFSEASNVYSKYSALMSQEEWYSGFDGLMAGGCKELIWGVKYTNLSNISSNVQFCYWYNQDPSYGEGMEEGPVYNFINLLVDQKYVDLFDNTDYRGTKCEKTTNVTDNDEKGVMFWHRSANSSKETKARWAYNKLKTYGDGGGAKQSHAYNIDFPLMRGSEMLLIMAEAEANLGNSAQALTYLNTLQAARNAQLTIVTEKSALLEKIYVERRKELLGEGVTGLYDLLRLQKPLVRYGATTTNPAGHFASGLVNLEGYDGTAAQPMGTIPANDYRFIMQIPQLEISNNSAISEADQNPFNGQ